MPILLTSSRRRTAAGGRRWHLLPLWMQAFTYLFLFFGLFTVPLFVGHLYGMPVPLTLYGIESADVLFHPGTLFVLGLYLLKGVAAFGLYHEEPWGVDLALVDGLLGILTCVLLMAGVGLLPVIDNYWFRTELFLLVPFVVQLWVTRRQWADASGLLLRR